MRRNKYSRIIIFLILQPVFMLTAAGSCYSKKYLNESIKESLVDPKPEGWHTQISYAQKTPDPLRLEREQAKVRNIMSYYHRQGLFPSFAAAVFSSDKVLFTHYINSSSQKVYSTGSVTKLITATLFQIMVEKKKISPEAPVTQYYPDLSELWKDYSSVPNLNHLISHTSGLPDLRYYPDQVPQKVESLNLNIVPPVYPPGSHYRYSNQGYIIAGNIIEEACGKNLYECAEQELYIPLGMNSSEGPVNGAGGFVTNLHDLIQFGRMYLNRGSLNGRRFLEPQSIEEMMHPGFYIPPSSNNFFTGRGWRVKRNEDGVVTIFHIGGANYVSAWLQLFPPYNTGIAYLGNPPEYSDNLMGFLVRMQYALGDLAGAYVSSPAPVYHWRHDQPDDALWSQFAGNYVNISTGETLKMKTNEKNELWLDYRGSYLLTPETHHHYTGGRGLNHQFVVEPVSNRVIGVANANGYFDRIPE